MRVYDMTGNREVCSLPVLLSLTSAASQWYYILTTKSFFSFIPAAISFPYRSPLLSLSLSCTKCVLFSNRLRLLLFFCFLAPVGHPTVPSCNRSIGLNRALNSFHTKWTTIVQLSRPRPHVFDLDLGRFHTCCFGLDQTEKSKPH